VRARARARVPLSFRPPAALAPPPPSLQHHWLARHVYLDAQRNLGLGRHAALALTFALSIAIHEAIIFSTLGRVATPYLALLSLLQLPLAVLQRAPWIKGKRLGNLVLWLGLSLGMSTTLVLYAKEAAGPCRIA